MSEIEQRLRALGYTLPAVNPPPAEFVPAVQVGNQLYLSGVVPFWDGQLLYQGKVESEVSIAQGAECARICALHLLAHARAALGDLDRLVRVVKLTAFVNADPTLDKPFLVADGASKLLVEVLGRERGAHARSAVGVAALPLNSPVEVEMVAEIRP